MTRSDVVFDADRWIRVPLDYADTPWRDAAEWAAWLAESATNGRAEAETTGPLVRATALDVALFPAPHVSARFWHYPVDGVPGGFVDVYLQQREPDGALARDLLPDPGFTALAPVVDDLDVAGCSSAVRRRSLRLVLRAEGDDEPAVLPRIEWLGVTDAWVGYLVTDDHDPAALGARERDTDELLRAIVAAGLGDGGRG